MTTDSQKNDPRKRFSDALVMDGDRVRGHLAVGPSGQLVVLRPGTIGLLATTADEVQTTGLKPGWRLADAGDVARKQKEAREADAARAARAKPWRLDTQAEEKKRDAERQ